MIENNNFFRFESIDMSFVLHRSYKLNWWVTWYYVCTLKFPKNILFPIKINPPPWLGRNFEQAEKDYSDHLGELERKIVQIVDAALQQQLIGWERKPPVPSNTFKAIGKQLLKLNEAIQVYIYNITVLTLSQ